MTEDKRLVENPASIEGLRERMQADESAIESEERFNALIQNLVSGVALIDEHGDFSVVNESFKRIFELDDQAPMLKADSRDWRQWRVFDENGNLLDLDEHPVRKALLTGTTVKDRLVAVQPPGSTVQKWLLISATPILNVDGDIKQVVSSYHDVTKLKAAEVALRESEAWQRLAQKTANVGTWQWTIDTNENVWSDELWPLYELDPHSCRPSAETWLATVHPDDRDRMAGEVQVATMAGTELNLEWRVAGTEDAPRWLMSRGQPQRDSSGKVVSYLGIVLDITERKKAETALLENQMLATQTGQLRALAGVLEKAREEERTRVAQFLHDDIGQLLIAVKMELNRIGELLAEKGAQDRLPLESMAKHINEAVSKIQRVRIALRPSILDDLGLSAAIRWQSEEFSSRTGMICSVSRSDALPDLTPDLATDVFRIFQECLTNVSRNAQATKVEVRLYKDRDDLVLEVRDNGKGFSAAAHTSSLGIVGIKERAQSCRGDMLVVSSPGEGTTVILRVPVGSGRSKEDDQSAA